MCVMAYQVLLFYKYCDIQNVAAIIEAQEKIATELSLFGRILIADEGINGTLCGSLVACQKYEAAMAEDKLFFDMNFKRSSSAFLCFKKLEVKMKDEIVILRKDKNKYSYKKSAEKITADGLHEEIQTNKELVLFDMRNQYESRIGRFVGAVCPPIQTTRELERYLEENKELFAEKDVVMYCTGGVRCERASVIVRALTRAKRLRHLENGIHAYAEKYPDGFFRGKNYVFDDRVALPVTADVLAHCDLCQLPSDLYNNCLNAICNKHHIACDRCFVVYKGCCSAQCIELTEKKEVPLRPSLPSRISMLEEQVSLKAYTWFQVGGAARYFARPKNEAEFQALIGFKKREQILLHILGQGANSLISDEGFSGIVLLLQLKEMKMMDYTDDQSLLVVGAGCSVEEVINYMLDQKLVGLEEFSGIPSSIGGALFINLHYFQFLISQFVFQAKVYDVTKEEILIVDNAWFCFGYDDSTLKRNTHYILLEATFLLKKASNQEIAFARGRSVEIIRHRKSRFPYEKTCGCFFKNFSKDQDGLMLSEGKKIVAAGYYLDQLGIKGTLKRGNSFVSSKHANMITHNGGGTATEIIEIARIMQQKTFEKFGLFLEPECALIGFDRYPLWTKDELLNQ